MTRYPGKLGMLTMAASRRPQDRTGADPSLPRMLGRLFVRQPASGRSILPGMLLAIALTALAMPITASSQVLRWAAQAEVQTLDPHAQNHPQTQAVLQHVYESLTRYTPRLQLEPALASSWEMLSPLVWRFHIRRGVRFHDGSPLTA